MTNRFFISRRPVPAIRQKRRYYISITGKCETARDNLVADGRDIACMAKPRARDGCPSRKVPSITMVHSSSTELEAAQGVSRHMPSFPIHRWHRETRVL